MDRILRIRTGKHPHEVLITCFLVALGVIGMIVPDRISVIASQFPWPWSMAYWICLSVTGSITLYGIFNKKIEGLLIERAGLTLQATLLGVYIYAIYDYPQSSGVTGMMLPLALISANLTRCWQIRKDLALLKSYLIDHPGERVR